MARSGIDFIDSLLEGKGPTVIGPGCTDAAAIGEVQDFLRCQGFSGMPAVTAPGRGVYGPRTSQAVRQFRVANQLGDGELVDASTLRKLVSLPASKPLASRCYLALALDIEPSGLGWIVCLTSQFESARNFSCLCLNTDGAGLSFGLIQWAQKPGRLAEILRAIDANNHARFVSIFGAGEESVAAGLLEQVSEPGGGVDPRTGVTTDPDFDLIRSPWVERFQTAGLDREWQAVQCATAIAAFSGAWNRLSQSVPLVTSERGVAYLLDLANQFGEGGARSVYRQAVKPGMSEADALEAMTAESIRRVSVQFGPNSPVVDATHDRRTFFESTELLSAVAFHPGQESAQV